MNCSFIILFLLLCSCNSNGGGHGHEHGHGCGNGTGSGFGICGCEEDKDRHDCKEHVDACSNSPIPPIMPIVENICNDDRRCREDRDFDRNRNRDCDRNRNRDCDKDRDRNRDRDCNCGMTPPPWTRSNYSNGDTCGCEEK